MIFVFGSGQAVRVAHKTLGATTHRNALFSATIDTEGRPWTDRFSPFELVIHDLGRGHDYQVDRMTRPGDARTP